MSVKIKTSDLVNLLKSRKSAFFVTIEAETEPSMRKTGNPFLGTKKKSVVNGLANFIYENSVNRQRKREGLEPDFEAEPRRWGTRLRGTPLVEHNGRYYLELKVEKTQNPTYWFDGKEIKKEELEAFMSEHSEGNQGVEKPVVLRDYKLENIRKVRMDGQEYEIVDE